MQTKEEARRVETLPQPRSTGFTAMLGEFHGHAHRVFTVTLNDSTAITLTASSGKNSRGNKSDIKMASQVTSMVPVTRDKVIHIGDPLGRSGVHHIVWLIDGNGGIPPLSSRLILDNIHG